MTELREQIVHALADRYRIEREIGARGMATVSPPRAVKHDRMVALKILDPELAAVMGVERFLAEIRVTAHLQHPNILPLFDSGEAPNGSLFYVMPFVAGETLRHRLTREKQLTVEEAGRITTAIASALDYAHRQGVIHRDLKPENVLFHEGQPLVADFGIALAAAHAGGQRITQTGVSLGTPSYMSPEQATGDRAIDGRTDIYSLGAMAYEMLTGEPPHTGSTAQAIIARVLTEKPRAVRVARPAVPVHIEAAVERALEKMPADRWETAGAFCDALDSRSSAALPSTAPRARRFTSLIAFAAIAIVVASAAVGVMEWRAALGARQGTVLRFTVPLNGGDRTGLSPAPAISPDGKAIAYSGFSPSGQPVILIRSLDDLKSRVLPGTESGLQGTFSPDGQWLVFYSIGALKTVHIATGLSRTLTATNLTEGIDWGPHNQIVASMDNRLFTIPASGGALKALTTLDTAHGEQAHRGPHFLDDGESVVFYSWRGTSEGSKVGIVSLKTGITRYVDIVGTPLGVIVGALIYVTTSSALFAVPFDAKHAQLTGTPVRLPDAVPIVGNGLGRASISRNGSLVYAPNEVLSELVQLDPARNTQIVLGPPRPYFFPRFSPDGKRIAVSIGSATSIDVWIYDIASRTATRITPDGSRNDRVEWTPDGKRVIYSTVGRRGMTALWMQNADRSDAPQLLEGRKNDQMLEGTISPNGELLAVRSTSPQHPHDIWYRRLVGDTTRRPIAVGPSQEYAPRFSPDGRWIAYTSDEDGANQVFVQPFPPTGAQYKVTDAGGITPVWSPEGRRIYYVNNAQMFVAAIETKPAFRVLRRDSLFAPQSFNLSSPVHAAFDVAPDGKHLLFLRRLRADNDMVVVHNWLTEVRRLLRGE